MSFDTSLSTANILTIIRTTISEVSTTHRTKNNHSKHKPQTWGTVHSTIITRAQSLTTNSKEKAHINVVVIGHVDSGKSTTTGRKHPPTHDLSIAASLTR